MPRNPLANLSRSFESQAGEDLNVYDFGAVGDGVTDDIVAISNALAAAQAAGGGCVRLGGGTFAISSPIVIPQVDNVSLRGTGNSTILQLLPGFVGAAFILYGGGATGINRLTIADLSLWGQSGTYSNNPAADGIQLNGQIQDTNINNVHFRALNGYPVAVLAGASGFIGYSNVINCVAKTCRNGYRFASTVPASNRSGGILITNCVSDNVQVGDAYLFDEVTDNVMTNCQGYAQNGSSIHIKGCAFLYISNCDIGGASPAVPCVLIEAGAAHNNDHITLDNLLIQKGVPGLQITAAAHVRVTGCEIFFNQTHGIEILDNAANGAILIEACQFYQNNRNSAATTYEIHNTSTHGSLLVRNCQFETGVGGGASQVAASIASPDFWQGLDVQANAFFGGSPTFSPAMIHKTVARNNSGFNPVGSIAAPGVPATTVAQQNDRGVDCMVLVTGGTVTNVAIGGVATGLTSGWFRVPALQTITLTYSVAPTWQWYGD